MNTRKILFGLVAGVVLSAGLLAYAISQPRANVQVELAPSSAKLVADNGKKISAGTVYLSPGRHTLIATQDGFTTATATVTVPKSGSIKVTMLIDPSTSVGYDYLTKHPDAQTEREALGGQKFSNNSELETTANPIIHLLPWQGQGYTINYGPDSKAPHDPTKIALVITLDSDADKSRALNWVRYNGFDPAKYEITYKYSYMLD